MIFYLILIGLIIAYWKAILWALAGLCLFSMFVHWLATPPEIKERAKAPETRAPATTWDWLVDEYVHDRKDIQALEDYPPEHLDD